MALVMDLLGVDQRFAVLAHAIFRARRKVITAAQPASTNAIQPFMLNCTLREWLWSWTCLASTSVSPFLRTP
ncbi:hypothetical protein CTI14_67040, partial [Methylobacterium radiotolerans]